MNKLLTFVVAAGLSLAAVGIGASSAQAQPPYRGVGVVNGYSGGYGVYGPRYGTVYGAYATPGVYRVQSSYAFTPGYGYGVYRGSSGYLATYAYPGFGFYPQPVIAGYNYNVSPFGGTYSFVRVPYLPY
jgi:hypothetical protein